MDKLTERVADSLRSVGLRGAVFLTISLLFIAVGTWRFWLNPERTGLWNYWAWGGWFLLCLPVLFVSDYVLHHAPIVFILFALFWLAFSIAEPHVAMETGVIILCVVSAAGVSTFQSFTNNDLIRAIEKGQAEKALSLIQSGIDVNAREGGGTALMEAVRRGSVQVVRALIAAHAAVNVPDSHGTTPLLAAVTARHREMVGMLIAAGADVNASDPRGDTPLIKTAFHGDAEICEALLKAGADLNAQNSEGYSALKWAIAMRKEEVATILRNAGAKEEPGQS
jgi:hypothetical protein